jgi:hypothetical protein
VKLLLDRAGLDIVPESVPDEMYIEHVLGLTRDGASIPLTLLAFRSNGYTVLKLRAEKRAEGKTASD